MTTPYQFLREAVKAVPSVRYALGVGGVVATVAIIYAFPIDPRVAVIGTVVMLVLMGVLVIFARMSSLPIAGLRWPALVFTWFVLCLFMILSGSLFTSVFFQRPLDLSSWLLPAPSATGGASTVVKIIDPTTGEELHYPSPRANPMIAIAENELYIALVKNDARRIDEAVRNIRLARASEMSHEAAKKAAEAMK